MSTGRRPDRLTRRCILLDAQGDRDLIQRIERQNRIQIVNFAYHAHSLIFFAPLLMVIQNTADLSICSTTG